MSTTYFEEMVTDSYGGKRNVEVIKHSEGILLGIGNVNSENDVSLQLVFNETQFKEFYQSLYLAGCGQGWLK